MTNGKSQCDRLFGLTDADDPEYDSALRAQFVNLVAGSLKYVVGISGTNAQQVARTLCDAIGVERLATIRNSGFSEKELDKLE